MDCENSTKYYHCFCLDLTLFVVGCCLLKIVICFRSHLVIHFDAFCWLVFLIGEETTCQLLFMSLLSLSSSMIRALKIICGHTMLFFFSVLLNITFLYFFYFFYFFFYIFYISFTLNKTWIIFFLLFYDIPMEIRNKAPNSSIMCVFPQIFYTKFYKIVFKLISLLLYPWGYHRRNIFRFSLWCLAWDSNPGFSSRPRWRVLNELNSNIIITYAIIQVDKDPFGVTQN